MTVIKERTEHKKKKKLHIWVEEGRWESVLYRIRCTIRVQWYLAGVRSIHQTYLAKIALAWTNGTQYAFRLIIIILSRVRLNPFGTAATTGLLYQPWILDDCDCVAIDGMKIGRGNPSTRRKPGPGPLCPPQIPLDQTRAWTRAAAVGSQRLSAWAMARPFQPDTCADFLICPMI
jgi:hypothetical protein